MTYAIELSKIGTQVKVLLQLFGTQEIPVTQPPIYCGRDEIKIQYNQYDTSVSVTIKDNATFSTGRLFDPIGTNLSIRIDNDIYYPTNEIELDNALKLLFPDEGGGSGITPSLEAVCNVGSVSTQNITVVGGNASADDVQIQIRNDNIDTGNASSSISFHTEPKDVFPNSRKVHLIPDTQSVLADKLLYIRDLPNYYNEIALRSDKKFNKYVVRISRITGNNLIVEGEKINELGEIPVITTSVGATPFYTFTFANPIILNTFDWLIWAHCNIRQNTGEHLFVNISIINALSFEIYVVDVNNNNITDFAGDFILELANTIL